MDMRMWIELAAVSVKGDRQTDFDAEFFRPFQQGIGSAGEKLIKLQPVVGKSGPEFIGHGEYDVLPFTVRDNMLLLGNPSLRGLHATGTLLLQLWQKYFVCEQAGEVQQ